jgi:hypothetical protein
MKKFFIAVLAILMMSGAVYAAELELSGSYYTRGRYLDNPSAQDDGGDAFMNYDHELEINGKHVISDTTYINWRMEIADQNWPGDAGKEAANADPTGDAITIGQTDDNLEVQRVWAGHTFGTKTNLETGLMTGGAWSTAFGEASGGRYRVKATQPTEFGTFIGILEKAAEYGSSVDDSEKNDWDNYALALVTKAADFTIEGLLFYINNGSNDLNDDKYDTTILVDLGVSGPIGPVNLVTEFLYWDYQFDETDQDDFDLYGIYVDASMTMDALNFGAFIAYGSVDDDTGIGFNFGDDFDGNGSEMIGNEFAFGGADAIGGSTYVGAYAGYAFSDALSGSAHIGYAMANDDLATASAAEEDTCTALSLGGAYKITDALTYSVGAGFSAISRDEGGDPDDQSKVWHRIKWVF